MCLFRPLASRLLCFPPRSLSLCLCRSCLSVSVSRLSLLPLILTRLQEDVLAGILIGIFSALCGYFSYYPGLLSPNSNLPLDRDVPWHPEAVMHATGTTQHTAGTELSAVPSRGTTVDVEAGAGRSTAATRT